jgi:lipopolysaccharide heptosyltransferase I
MTDGLRLDPAPLSTLHAARICLIKPSAMGDIVQSLPVLAALRRRFPRAHIAWLVNRSFASLVRPIPILDETIEFDRDAAVKEKWAGVRTFAAFARELRARRFDLAIDLQGLLRSGLLTLATCATKRIGLRSAREGSGLCYTETVDDLSGSPAAVDRYWKVAEALGVGRLAKEFPFGITRAEEAAAEDLLGGLPRPIMGLLPGARWETKRWPAERFAEAANAAVALRPGSVVVLGSPDEIEIADRTAQLLRPPARNLAGKTTLRTLAAALARCELLLTNDSGPMHLAAALGVRTAALFTCTSPERAGPFGAGHSIVQTTVSCRGSYLKKCDRMVCMDQLTTDALLPILDAAWRRPPGDRDSKAA